jgi:hypothetical protein
MAEWSREGYGSKRAVLPMLMMNYSTSFIPKNHLLHLKLKTFAVMVRGLLLIIQLACPVLFSKTMTLKDGVPNSRNSKYTISRHDSTSMFDHCLFPLKWSATLPAMAVQIFS